MAAAPCLSELSRLSNHRNISLISGARPCNRNTVQNSPYTSQAMAAFAIAITFMVIVTIVGNILVIIAVLTSRTLKGAQNLFLVSLAAADILVATLIIPFSLANELQGYWAFSSIWCEIYLALDVLFCTSSIVHLCAISLDRYLSISRPVSYAAKRTPNRIKAAIIVVWLISAVVSFPPLLSLDKREAGEEVCELNNERWYILYSSIGSFFAPCVIMILVYIRIYQIAKQHTRGSAGQKRKASVGESINELGLKSSERLQQNGDRESLNSSQRANAFKMSSTPSSLHKLASMPGFDPPGIHNDCQKESNKEFEALPESREEMVQPPERENKPPNQVFTVQEPDMSPRYKNTMVTSSGTKLAPEESIKTFGTPLSRRKAMMNREKRFTFVLAVVMGVFVVCWFPFFFSYSLMAVCPTTCSIPKPLFKFFFWIGYCNSCLNPVIYTIFNNDFRKAFKRILCRDTKGTYF
ncbi:alpha-2B adrenergic receptor [Gouania willdenowi]|uniref:Alpha-2B adrenergic receptor n=1 Tax=Gouania willdenowi TaxID=441366 RepID=A0A8C5DWE6_GOUWI|nr:alpha-2B adrenergic receptor-like [Gouania willdenowi]